MAQAQSQITSAGSQALIDRLGLAPHPEGGWFAEVYRSSREVASEGQTRSAATHIHFLLAEGDVSRWHVVSSDEIWHFYEGSPLALHVFDPASGELTTAKLGPLDDGCVRHRVVPRGCWQAARSLGGFSLVGCTVAPGFSFDDFRFVSDLSNHQAAFRGVLEDLSSFL